MVWLRTNLDMDVLRTFVTGVAMGSFAKAADRLGRSQSAISTQLRKLEDQTGKVLFRKSGRGLVLTVDGETLLTYARRILDMNDEVLDSLHGQDMEGWVRLGIPQDFAETWLPAVLGRFARTHPKVRIKVYAEHRATLIRRLRNDELDLALLWGSGIEGGTSRLLTNFPVRWIGLPNWPGMTALAGEPLSLVAFEEPCLFLDACRTVLDKANIPWRIGFSSGSVASHWAAVQAGLGIAMRTTVAMPAYLSALDPQRVGLPPLHEMPVVIQTASATPDPATQLLAEIIGDTILERADFLMEHNR